MGRPPVQMRTYAADENLSHNLRFIAKSAEKHGITLQMMAKYCGCSTNAIRNTYERDNAEPETIERYLKALVKDGKRLYSNIACKSMAGTLTFDDMGDMIKDEVEPILEQRYKSDRYREKMHQVIDGLDAEFLTDAVSQFLGREITDPKLTQGLNEVALLISDLQAKHGFSVGDIVTAALVSNGADPWQAAFLISSTFNEHKQLKGFADGILIDSMLKGMNKLGSRFYRQLSSMVDAKNTDLE